MKRHKLGFGNKTVLEQIAICRRVAHGIARLPAQQREVMAQHPVADSVEEAAKARAEVEQLKAALRAAVVRCRTKTAAMRDATTDAASGLTALLGGEPAALLASGLGVVKDKQPVGLPGTPRLLRVVSTDFEGTVRLRWKRPVRRCAFIIQMTTDKAAARGWKQADICSRQTHDVKGLPSGKKIWLRVAAANAHGQGPWSQPVRAWVK